MLLAIHVKPGHCFLGMPLGLVSLVATYAATSLEFCLLPQDVFGRMPLLSLFSRVFSTSSPWLVPGVALSGPQPLGSSCALAPASELPQF